MVRRERASSVTRMFRTPHTAAVGSSAQSPRRSQSLRSSPSTQSVHAPQPSPRPDPLLLESLFDSAPESWIALLPQPSRSSQPAEGELAAADQALLHRLAAIAGGFTSRVSLEPPDALLLEVRGSFQLFGGAQSLCLQLLERCRQAGSEPSWSLAPTPLAALALARAGCETIVLARDRLAGVLSPLPLKVLAWSASTVARLDAVGVRTLGAALRLPRAGFAQRFGQQALLALDRLTGAAPEPRRTFVTRERFRAQREPGFELWAQSMVLQCLEPLLIELEDFLRTRQSGIDLLMLRLQHRNHPPTRIDLRLASTELLAKKFRELLALRLSQLELPVAVQRIELRSGPLQTLLTISESIWRPGEHGGAAGRESPALIERLRARLGSAAVYGLCLVPEHRPENAWGVAEPVAGATSVTNSTLSGMSRRPLWLLHEPEVLPSALQGRRIVEGPERIETGWWDGRDVARDYYIARDTAGAELWVYRERMPSHAWYLHGIFG